MKPVVLDMNEMSDSTEVYESRPNRFLIYTIYLILFILVTAIVWMSLSKIEIVVKSNGIFKGGLSSYDISSDVTGSIKETQVENGQYVNEGDILYVLDVKELSETMTRYQTEFESAKDRIEILNAYEKSLDGDKGVLEACASNQYYSEFVNRRKLLYANESINKKDTEGQILLYQGTVDSISNTIEKYNYKIDKLNIAKQCITSRDNGFDISESTYYSIVNSYISSYNYTKLQYDNKVNEYQCQIDEYDNQIKNACNNILEENAIVGVNIDELKNQRDTLILTRDSTASEKNQALMNLELQQLNTIEQQIAGYNDTIQSLESNLTSAKMQLAAANSTDSETQMNVVILTEKGSIAEEILGYEEKKRECEAYLKSCDIQNNSCNIKANISGYFYNSQEMKIGRYVEEGSIIGSIYQEEKSQYYAEVYVANKDIAGIKVGQKVKFEISAYPSSEYGYFKGTVERISKDISVDQNTGYSYYLVKIKCNKMALKGKDGKEVKLMNGMACQAKIVIEEKNVLSYFLEKINLVD